MATKHTSDHEGAVSVLVHNSRSQNHFIFGKESSSGGGETVELQDLSKPAQRRRRKASASDDDEAEESFVLHELEPHHTIRGIALQYRSTVRAQTSPRFLFISSLIWPFYAHIDTSSSSSAGGTDKAGKQSLDRL